VHGLDGGTTLDPAAVGSAATSLEELHVVAIELRALLERGRVADARDLQPAYGQGDAGVGVLHGKSRTDCG